MEPESPHNVATGEGDGATSKEKVFRKPSCLRNSSQTERNDAEVLVRLLSAGDGSGSASKEKVFRKQRCLHNSSLKSVSTTKQQRTQCL